MHRRVLLRASIILLVFVFSFTHGGSTDTVPPDEDTTVLPPATTTTTAAPAITTTTTAAPATITTTTKTTTTRTSTRTTTRNPFGSGYGSRNSYGYDGYLNDEYEIIADYGNDPSPYGTDIGDFGPIYKDKPTMLSALDFFISSADDWEKDTKKKPSKPRPSYDKYNKDKNYDKKDYKSPPRRKRAYKKTRFPAKHIPNYKSFPFGRFPPLISIFPWLPIFYDKLTYQTFIFSPTGGLYIIPPLINFYGRRFAVAQLIKWGYASLVSTGAPPVPGIDVAPLVSPPPPPPPPSPPAGGAVPPPTGPSYDSSRLQFDGGVKTNFYNFKPRYGQTLDDGGARNYGSSGGSSYGGTRTQDVYPQGGPRNY